MGKRFTTDAVETLSDGFIELKRHTITYQRSDGTDQRLVREIHDHGHAASILPVDWSRETVLLVRQFRLPVALAGDQEFLIEAIAGLLDDDAPHVCAEREALEEAGVAVADLRHVFTGYSSPGCVTERTSFFLAEYDADDRVGTGGGLSAEGEDIEVLEIGLDTALDMLASGEIRDMKAMILLHCADRLRRERK